MFTAIKTVDKKQNTQNIRPRYFESYWASLICIRFENAIVISINLIKKKFNACKVDF